MVASKEVKAGFADRLLAASAASRSLLCVGLDPDPELMAVPDLPAFLREIVGATSDLVCAYKPNMGFFEALGIPGLQALEETLSHIRDVAPTAVVIGDAKRGDIASSSRQYARAMFDRWGFDAVTVNPYTGRDSLEPFFDYRDRGVLVLCRSSNPGGADFQDLVLSGLDGGTPLYEHVATKSREWNVNGNVGLVVGATYPSELARVRGLCPDMPILVPAVGAQQGAVSAAVTSGVDARGRNLVISSSRSVLYASSNQGDFAASARDAASSLVSQINQTLDKIGKGW